MRLSSLEALSRARTPAIALAVCTTEDKHAFIALEGLVKWFDHVVAEFGGWHVGAYVTVIKQGAGSTSPLVTNDSGVAFYGPNIQWQAGGRFTLTPYANYVPFNGDRFVFADPVSGIGPVTPAGFSKYTPYYMVNLSGLQFDLATSPGGSPMQITDTYNGSAAAFVVASKPPATGSISNIGAPTSYNTEVVGMLNYAIAIGTPVLNKTISDLTARNEAAGLDLRPDPKWGMKTKFG